MPIIYISPKLGVASFNLLGDAELVRKTALALSKKVNKIDFDCLVGPEVKVVPLMQELSNLLKQKRYVVMRKNIMGYMVDPVISKSKPSLVLNGPDAKYLNGKKIIVVDDVVTTGKTVKVIKDFLDEVGAKVVLTVAVIKQGDVLVDSIENTFFLAKLPLIRK